MKDRFGLLKARLKIDLKSARYRHTSGVARLACKLAKCHGLDPVKAEWAGWLHDCGKALGSRAQKGLLLKCKADAFEKTQSPLWHAVIGGWLARSRYGCKDKAVLSAIRWHTTGKASMSQLEKLIFVADYCEPSRPWPSAKKLRGLAKKDLEAAWREVCRHKIIDLLERSRPVHPRAWAAYAQAFG